MARISCLHRHLVCKQRCSTAATNAVEDTRLPLAQTSYSAMLMVRDCRSYGSDEDSSRPQVCKGTDQLKRTSPPNINTRGATLL